MQHVQQVAERAARGFTLVELIIVLSISAALAAYAQSYLVKQTEESIAKASASYLLTVANSAQYHTLLNFNNYANSTPVAGIANLLTPTLAELRALGRLPVGFPIVANSMPTRQTAQVNLVQTNCPGPTCTIQVLACTTTPVTLGAPVTPANIRFDLASTMVEQQNGAGGQSLQGAGNVIRGPLVNTANPIGNQEGIVCGTQSLDTTLYQRFLTVGDPRDPNFQGNLTVAGATVLGVNGAGNPGTTVNNSLNVNGGATVTGNVNANQNVAVGGNLTVTGTSTLTGAVTSGSSVNVGTTLGVGGDITGNANASFTGRISADRLVATGSYTIGTPCSLADNGAIGRSALTSGLVTCQNGLWTALNAVAKAGDICGNEGAAATDDSLNAQRGKMLLCVNGTYRSMETLVRFGTPNGACSQRGVTAIDTANNNETLICKDNPLAPGILRYYRLADLTSNLSFVGAEVAYDDYNIAKPICLPASGMTAVPIMQLNLKTYASADGGISVYSIDTGAAWQVKLKQGTGARLLGSCPAGPVNDANGVPYNRTSQCPTATAQTFCYYQ